MKISMRTLFVSEMLMYLFDAVLLFIKDYHWAVGTVVSHVHLWHSLDVSSIAWMSYLE